MAGNRPRQSANSNC